MITTNAPPCDHCGELMIRNGDGYKCLACPVAPQNAFSDPVAPAPADPDDPQSLLEEARRIYHTDTAALRRQADAYAAALKTIAEFGDTTGICGHCEAELTDDPTENHADYCPGRTARIALRVFGAL